MSPELNKAILSHVPVQMIQIKTGLTLSSGLSRSVSVSVRVNAVSPERTLAQSGLQHELVFLTWHTQRSKVTEREDWSSVMVTSVNVQFMKGSLMEK